MKKDRNSFFSQYGVQSYNSGPFMSPNMMNQPQTMPMSDSYDLESRINRLEREINRLDTRISKLEGLGNTASTATTNNDYNFANSMYMV